MSSDCGCRSNLRVLDTFLQSVISGFLGNAGPDRRIYLPEGLLAKDEIPPYLTGEVPGE